MWLVNLLRELPPRVGRLAIALWRGVRGLVLALPQAYRAATDRSGPGLAAWLRRVPRDVGIWLIVLLFRVLDLFGVPELWSFFLQMVCHVTPLTGPEIGAASEILGPTAIRYADVRIAEGGALNFIFARNGGRAFTTFHTVNLPKPARTAAPTSPSSCTSWCMSINMSAPAASTSRRRSTRRTRPATATAPRTTSCNAWRRASAIATSTASNRRSSFRTTTSVCAEEHPVARRSSRSFGICRQGKL